MKRKFTILAALALLVFMAPSMVGWGQTRTEASLVALTFPDDNFSNNGLTSNQYTSTWTAQINDYEWSISNFNNNNWNNNWTYIKCGRKNNASVAAITNSAAYTESISRVAITITNITSDKVNSIKLYISSDDSNWTEAGSFLKETGTQSVALTNPAGDLYYKIEFNCASGSSNGLVTVSKVEYFYNEGNPTVVTPTFTPNGGNFLDSQEVSISCVTDGATIYYTTNGNDPTTSSSVYSAPFTIDATTTVKAFAVKSGMDNSAVASATFTKVIPMTVAEARAAIDAGTGTQDVYVTGIVSSIVEAWNTQYSNISFNMSDDGLTTSDQLEAFRCVSTNNANASEVGTGDVVVVHGNLTLYNNTTYEFTSGCQLVSLEHSATAIATPTFSPAAGTYTEAQSVTISCETPNVTIYYTTNGNDPDDESTQYTGPITVGESMTIKAIAYDANDNTSAIATAEYVINLPAPAQTFNLIDGHNPVEGETYLIVDLTSGKALTSANGSSSSPAAVEVTIEDDQIITDNVALQWTFEATEGGYIIHPLGSSTTWLCYTTTNNTGIRVGTNEANVWTLDITDDNSDYHGFKHNGTSRYIGVYQGTDWRGYTTIHANIKETQIALFVLGDAPVVPSITANNVTITYDTDADEIEYEINNPVDGGSLVASTDSDWLEVGDEAYTSNAGTIEFTCSVNPTAAARSATVTLTYTYNRATVTKNVTVTQEAAPAVLTNIEDVTEGGSYTVQGTIVAMNARGFIVGDGTGYVYYYEGSNFSTSYAIDDNVTLTGTTGSHNNVIQFPNGTTIEEAENSNYNNTPAVQVLDAAGIGAYSEGLHLSDYVQIEGALSHSGNYYNITIEGVENTASISFPNDAQQTLLNGLDNKQVIVKGYFAGVSGGHFNVILESIEEVEVPHEEYTVTVSNLVNVNTYLFNGDEMVLEGEGTVNILDGNEVLIRLDVAEGYVIESLMVDGNNVTSQIAEDHSYTFNMPTHNVTITATAVEIPVFTPATYTLASTVESGKQYIIVAQRVTDEAVEYYAMGEQRNSNRKGVLVNANDNTITVNSEEVYEFTISSLEGENFYSIYDARTPGYLYAAASSGNQLKTEATLDENHNGDWEINIDATTNVASVSATNSNNRHVMQFNYNGGNPAIFSCYADATQTAVYLYVKDETPAGTPLFISGYNGSAFANGGYHLIATPVDGIDPANVTNMTNGNYDLYMFDQSGDDEWVNYRQGNNQFAFTELVAGMGYLYAHDTDITLYFEGDLIEGDSYDVSLVLDTDSEFPGWNLVGNSFTVPASIGDRDYYEMHENGRDLIQTSGAIDPMQGIFVIAETDEEELTFSKTITTGGSKVVMNVTSDRSSLVDRATIRFGEGRQLRKIQLNPDNTKIYITEGNTDYAVVRSSDEAEITVSFKTAENGTYTINFSTEEVEMEYMHLIDNMTGADVDLLATPSYTFEARTTDYASRFRLVFATTTGVSENSENNFAFYNGGNWVVNNMGDATLQVVDMLGHILSSETINGNASISIDQVPGVYMIRLVSGNDVKVQKVIIK